MHTMSSHPIGHITRIHLLLALVVTLAMSADLERKWQPVPAEALAKIARAIPPQATVPAKQPRKLLIFCRVEGYVHASIPYANAALARMGEATGAYRSEIRDDMGVFTPENLAPFDAIALVSTSHLKFADPAHRRAFLEFLAKGHGLIGLHAATDNFFNWPEAQQLIGGLFHDHPWTAKDTVAVKLDDPTHPLVACFHGNGFWIREEIYQIVGDYSRENQRVLLSLDMSKAQNQRPATKIVRTDNDFPISWLKQTKDGIRVFYSSLGHREDIYYVPEILQHFLDGIQFALGDLTADAVPSAKLATAPAPALAPEKVLVLQDRSARRSDPIPSAPPGAPVEDPPAPPRRSP